ncbi:MAG TPA: hypothetical protein VHY91_08530 [Pirellulales bacterium]|jgi:hypothetical protein|nr:hypothetical protein [Pirellulales bacterium]
MIVVHCLVISCCLVAQAGDAPSSAVPKPKFSTRKHQPAPANSPPAEGAESEAPAAQSPYDRAGGKNPAHQLLQDLDAAGGMAGDQAGSELRHVDAAAQRLRPPELLADALSGPHQGRLPSRPLPLVDALARTTDRQQQRQIAVAYWRLAIAQAQLHYARENLERLRRWIQPGHKHSTLVESQLATAEAAAEDAEFRVINEGESLATLVGWPDNDQIPATVDRPHVGDYRTEFEALFKSQTPPPRLRLIHRTLPISRRAIDVHGAALVTAHDALAMTEEDYHEQKSEYLTLAAALDRLVAEQTAFLMSVLRYNEDIAEYAFFTVPATADAGFLAKRLITRPAPPSHPRAETPQGEQPGATEDSFNTDSTQRDTRPRTFRERAASDDRSRDDPASTASPRPRVWLVAAETPAEPAHGGLYQGLLGSEPALQAQGLTGILHWDRELPPDAGEKLSLVDCLERAGPAKRRAAIALYWNTRQQAACYQVLGERSEMLAGLAGKLLALRAEPGGAAGMLRLHAAREAAEAAVLDQHIRLLTAQYELVLLLESPPDRPWPLPSTAPHGGDYRVASSDNGQKDTDRSPDQPPSLGRAGTRVVVLHTELTHRARALVFADEFRALHTPDKPHQPAEIDSVMRAIDRQLRDTEVFLGTLTDYNLAVADFILPLFPPGTPAKGLVEKLVVEQSPPSGT